MAGGPDCLFRSARGRRKRETEGTGEKEQGMGEMKKVEERRGGKEEIARRSRRERKGLGRMRRKEGGGGKG